MKSIKWNRRMLSLARHIAGWSKDPSTRVGAVLTDDKHRVLGIGFNGFPRGVGDTKSRYKNRAQKYPRVVHAELNAVLNAVLNAGRDLTGATVYVWPVPPCPACTAALIQAGVRQVVWARAEGKRAPGSIYYELTKEASSMMAEAGVECELYVLGSVLP